VIVRRKSASGKVQFEAGFVDQFAVPVSRAIAPVASPQLLYRAIGTGELPVEPLTLGRRYRWPTVPVAQSVGLPTEIVHQTGDAAA